HCRTDDQGLPARWLLRCRRPRRTEHSVKLAAVALDYDGTMTNGDCPGESIRAAIAALRSTGIFVVIVTGRILSDLVRVAGDLHFVDAVVAENGAVVHFPSSGYTRALASSIPGSFVSELGRRA